MLSVRLFLFQDDFGVDAFVDFVSKRWPNSECRVLFKIVRVVGVFTKDDLRLITELYTKVYKRLTKEQWQELAALVEIHSLTTKDKQHGNQDKESGSSTS